MLTGELHSGRALTSIGTVLYIIHDVLQSVKKLVAEAN
jgi:hypothetical protein